MMVQPTVRLQSHNTEEETERDPRHRHGGGADPEAEIIEGIIYAYLKERRVLHHTPDRTVGFYLRPDNRFIAFYLDH
jgi:hypothetical protein